MSAQRRSDRNFVLASCGTALACVLIVGASAPQAKDVSQIKPAVTRSPASSPPPPWFTDIRKSAGVTFQQDSTESDEKYYLETMGTGVAWIDYDQDGLMDL